MVDFIHFLDHIYLLSIATHLLTHFVRSLIRLALLSVTQLPSVALCARFAHAYRLLTSFALLYARFTHSLRSFASFTLCACFTRSLHSFSSTLTSLTHFVRSLHLLIAHSLCSFALCARSLRLLCALKLSIINSINWFCALRSCISLYTISRAEADCRMTPFACTITFYYSFVQSLRTKKFFHKIVLVPPC